MLLARTTLLFKAGDVWLITKTSGTQDRFLLMKLPMKLNLKKVFRTCEIALVPKQWTCIESTEHCLQLAEDLLSQI